MPTLADVPRLAGVGEAGGDGVAGLQPLQAVGDDAVAGLQAPPPPPDSTTRSPPTDWPSVTSRNTALLSPPTT